MNVLSSSKISLLELKRVREAYEKLTPEQKEALKEKLELSSEQPIPQQSGKSGSKPQSITSTNGSTKPTTAGLTTEQKFKYGAAGIGVLVATVTGVYYWWKNRQKKKEEEQAVRQAQEGGSLSPSSP